MNRITYQNPDGTWGISGWKGERMERLTQSNVNIGFLDSNLLPSYEALYEKLRNYEDLEEQGLLIRLPCSHWLDVVFGEQEVFWGIDTDYIETPIREITVYKGQEDREGVLEVTE